MKRFGLWLAGIAVLALLRLVRTPEDPIVYRKRTFSSKVPRTSDDPEYRQPIVPFDWKVVECGANAVHINEKLNALPRTFELYDIVEIANPKIGGIEGPPRCLIVGKVNVPR